MATNNEIWKASYQFGVRMENNLPVNEIEEAWLRFIKSNPCMLTAIESLMRDMIASKMTEYSTTVLIGKLKWDYAMRGEHASMNDHLRPFCARYLNYTMGSRTEPLFRLKIRDEERPLMRMVGHSPEFDRAAWIERMTPLQQNFVRFL